VEGSPALQDVRTFSSLHSFFPLPSFAYEDQAVNWLVARLSAEMASSESAVPKGMDNFTVGLIGMGDMGRMYAEKLSAAGWR
jgi:prephenate dehydrogenase (NADP+)